MLKRITRIVCLAVFVTAAALAQSQGTGSITGTIQDASNLPVPKAEVVATNAGTGLERKSVTDSLGSFTIPVIPTGEYSVKISAPGFSTLEERGIIVNVGAVATVTGKLAVSSVQQTVTVEDAALLVEQTRTEEASLVDRTQINTLPINGRRADQFALLVPGVARSGTFGLLTFRGMSSSFNNYMIEGNDDNQAYFGEARGRTREAFSISSNAIQEFQVGKSNFLAEFGRAVGGSINSVVRSGGNGFHADGFYYFRNSDMEALDPYVKQTTSVKPTDTRQQFGGSVAGPIKKEKFFYFVNYDAQYRNFPIVILDGGALAAGKPTNPSSPTYTSDLAAYNAGVNWLLSHTPGGAFGNTNDRNGNQHSGLVKTDWLVNQKNSVSVTYNKTYWYGVRNIQSPIFQTTNGSNGSDDVRIDTINARLTTTFTSSTVNELRFQWGRDLEFEFSDTPPPNVSVNGYGYGRATYLQRTEYPNEHHEQVAENISVIRGTHSFKFGFDYNRPWDRLNSTGNFGGAYSYTNALNFGKDLLDPTARNYSSFTQAFGLTGDAFATQNYSFFAQDQWRLNRKITVNYGLRYELQTFPKPFAPNPAIPETQKFNVDKTAFGPRAGIAYDLAGNSKTVLRAGYGMFNTVIQNGMIDNALRQTGLPDPTKNTVSLTFTPTSGGAPTFPNVLSAVPTGASVPTPSVFRIASDFKRPRAQEINVGIDRQLTPTMALSASYIYTYGDQIYTQIDSNLPTPQFTRTFMLPNGTTFQVPYVAGPNSSPNSVRPNTALGQVILNTSSGESWYNAMFIELKRRFTKGLQLNLSYTLSKTENTTGTAGGDGSSVEGSFNGGRFLDQFSKISNRGIAPTDQRQRLGLNSVWYMPFAQSGTDFGSQLAKGWVISGIVSEETGRPYATSISVPSMPFTNTDGTVWNGLNGGLLGQGGLNVLPTVSRNNNTGRPNYRLDLRLSRQFKIRERLTTEFFFEAFNVFNHSNWTNYNTTAYIATAPPSTAAINTPVQLTANAPFGIPNGDGSQPDGTNARRLQISARFRF
jgi:hypothetical protein